MGGTGIGAGSREDEKYNLYPQTRLANEKKSLIDLFLIPDLDGHHPSLIRTGSK